MLARQHASSIFTFSTRSFSRRAAQGKPRGQAAQLASMSSAAHLAAAQGAVVGAFVGDASGAPLEFMPQPTLEQVNEALTMPGGGVWNVGPGQVTDDSEMALCLLRGLEQAAAPSLPEEAIARAYADWYITGPFDIGNTCSTACSAAAEATRSGSAVAAAMRSAAHEVGSVIFPLVAEGSMHSKANGALMRVTPLAVWGHALSDGQLADCARREAELTHPNITCQDASAAYCIALASLMRTPGDARSAFQRASSWATASADEDVRGFLAEAQAPELSADFDCTDRQGYLRWAFVLAFRHLLRSTDYVSALQDTLLRGGDTDTNACIVGGMIGALHGLDAIPADMRMAVLNRSADSPGNRRPDFLQPVDLLNRIQRLYAPL